MPAISTLSDPERELVKKEIATFLLGTDQRLIDRRALAEQLHALPLYSDMGGCILLEPTGQLVLVHSNQSYFGPVRAGRSSHDISLELRSSAARDDSLRWRRFWSASRHGSHLEPAPSGLSR
jgi:hypothetical protein